MIAQTHDKSRLKSEEVGCGSLSQQAVVTPKNPIKILKGLNKYNHIILLEYKVYVLWCIILLSMKIKENAYAFSSG